MKQSFLFFFSFKELRLKGIVERSKLEVNGWALVRTPGPLGTLSVLRLRGKTRREAEPLAGNISRGRHFLESGFEPAPGSAGWNPRKGDAMSTGSRGQAPQPAPSSPPRFQSDRAQDLAFSSSAGPLRASAPFSGHAVWKALSSEPPPSFRISVYLLAIPVTSLWKLLWMI